MRSKEDLEIIKVDAQEERRKTLKIRNKIFERDKYQCRACGRKENLEIHHMLSIFNGGSSEEDNLITLCECCHKSAPEDGKENNELYIKDKYEYLYNKIFNNNQFYNYVVELEKNYNLDRNMAKDLIIESLKVTDEMYESGKRLNALKGKAKSGEKPCGKTPYGYKWEDTKIVVNKEEAKVVELIFRKYLDLRSIQKVERYLKENGYKTRGQAYKQVDGTKVKKNIYFSKKAILDILRNDFYKGNVKYGEVKTVASHKPIVSKIIFGKVQNLLNENRIKYRGKK